MKRLEIALSGGADVVWPLVQRVNAALRPGRHPQPRWAPEPLLTRRQRTSPPLGWPRGTDSLCPQCVREARAAILAGAADPDLLRRGSPGRIPARIVERDGRVLMEKECARHGRCEDLLSIDPAFLARIERLFPGRDYRSPFTPLRDHGDSSVRYGRGAVLTIDLTNRCNMMCGHCFMDANQVGYVHELSLEDVRKILDDSLRIEPHRQLSVQFSGGEPTLHPDFLAAVAHAKHLGYFSIQAATNGIRFAQELQFAFQSREAGLRIAYLQFDGIGNPANAHRRVGNLFDVKLRAIEHLAKADIDVVLVVTVARTVNDDQVGPILRFALDNADKVSVVAFQPISFAGRDEDVSEAERARLRYTLSHLAHDIRRQTGVTEPLVDWYPLSALGVFSDLVDLMKGPGAEWGAMKCGCHPDCGIGTVLLVDTHTQCMTPLSEFFDLERFLADGRAISDAARGRRRTRLQLALALARNFDPRRAPLSLQEFLRKFDKQSGGHAGFDTEADSKWRLLFVAGMWFQDLFNYDFRRTEMCVIPYGTQEGEISFCAYNTGVGWRQIVESKHRTASTAAWYKQHGKHPVHANGGNLPLPPASAPPGVRVRPQPGAAPAARDWRPDEEAPSRRGAGQDRRRA